MKITQDESGNPLIDGECYTTCMHERTEQELIEIINFDSWTFHCIPEDKKTIRVCIEALKLEPSYCEYLSYQAIEDIIEIVEAHLKRKT